MFSGNEINFLVESCNLQRRNESGLHRAELRLVQVDSEGNEMEDGVRLTFNYEMPEGEVAPGMGAVISASFLV